MPGQRIDWISEGGHEERNGTMVGKGLFYPDGSDMYVYYNIVFWRPAEPREVCSDSNNKKPGN